MRVIVALLVLVCAPGASSSDEALAVLNRYVFGVNVLTCNTGCDVDNWVVLFCVSWLEGCQAMKQSFESTAELVQDEQNADAMIRRRVRFAEVDCATDKVLCNEQLVDGYPTVVHYRRSVRVSEWVPSVKGTSGFHAWVSEEDWVGTVVGSSDGQPHDTWVTMIRAVSEEADPMVVVYTSLMAAVVVTVIGIVVKAIFTEDVPASRATQVAPPRQVTAPSPRPTTPAVCEADICNFLPRDWDAAGSASRSTETTMEL
eukprot:TRINITY_DN44202_c0_g1_i1.p1 TRINITY_DN44202_c0_g1~~TRINITY_DN44202_c0_g1_i1.p1  ORF type:complete len:257 (-),score=49.48 TRINITY_DN44202_c0_g1_i1:40-810(-)